MKNFRSPINPTETFLNNPLKHPLMAKEDKITKDMTLGECIQKHPETVGVFMKHGLHCIGCHIAAFESIEQGAKGHGMSDEEVEKMVKELNEAVEK